MVIRKLQISTRRIMKLNQYVSPYTHREKNKTKYKIKFKKAIIEKLKWICDVNVRPDFLKLKEGSK